MAEKLCGQMKPKLTRHVWREGNAEYNLKDTVPTVEHREVEALYFGAVFQGIKELFPPLYKMCACIVAVAWQIRACPHQSGLPGDQTEPPGQLQHRPVLQAGPE